MKTYRDKEKIEWDNISPKLHAAGVKLSNECEWNGADICRAFAEALTDANFHRERAKLVPYINRIFGIRIDPVG